MAASKVYYKEYIEVGGATFGQNFIPFLRDRGMPKQPRAFEWCCGAGFIAFSMYAQGLCETIGMSDISTQAIRACRQTIETNGLAGSRGRLRVRQPEGHSGLGAMGPGAVQSAAPRRRIFRRPARL